jgi:hypothetical protein
MEMRRGHATRTCRLTFQRHAAWTFIIEAGMQNGDSAGKRSKDMQLVYAH